MLEGTCKKCGIKHHGWALNLPEHRVCACGEEIEVTEVTIGTVDNCITISPVEVDIPTIMLQKEKREKHYWKPKYDR